MTAWTNTKSMICRSHGQCHSIPGQAKPVFCRFDSLVTMQFTEVLENESPDCAIFVLTIYRQIDCSTPLQVAHVRGVTKGSMLLSRAFLSVPSCGILQEVPAHQHPLSPLVYC